MFAVPFLEGLSCNGSIFYTFHGRERLDCFCTDCLTRLTMDSALCSYYLHACLASSIWPLSTKALLGVMAGPNPRPAVHIIALSIALSGHAARTTATTENNNYHHYYAWDVHCGGTMESRPKTAMLLVSFCGGLFSGVRHL